MAERDRLSDDLIARMRARIRDDWRRTGDGDWQRTPLPLRRKHEIDSLIGRVLDHFVQSSFHAEAQPLKPIETLSAKAVAKAEAKLGFPIPAPLKQLYLEVGDGGFGPFSGIRRLANWIKDYQKLVAEPIGQRRRDWPRHLLPIVYLGGPRICLDKESGEVILWTKPLSRASDAKWRESFVPQAASLGEWLEAWVDNKTEAEGGPVGGWTAPAEELERRAAVEEAKEAKKEAEANRPVDHAELAPLDDLILHRIRMRALDPGRRTATASLHARARPMDVDSLLADVDRHRDAFPPGFDKTLHRMGALARVFGAVGGLAFAQAGPGIVGVMGSAAPLGEPATDARIAAAEARLGFALPRPLRQLYAIGDGGYGPGDQGLFGLDELARRYRDLCSKPQGPGDEPWPTKLLPLYEADPALGCLDLETGAIVIYDVQEMDDVSSFHWRRAFVPGPASIAAMMDEWLGEPTIDEQMSAYS